MFRWVGSILNPFQSIGLLLVRVSMGTAFMLHGLDKIRGEHGMFAWMQNADVPDYVQAAAALSELIGGGMIAIGFLTRLAALALVGVMAGAFWFVHIPNQLPFVAAKPGEVSFELAAIYLACSVLLVFSGAGVLSVDGIFFRRKAAPPA